MTQQPEGNARETLASIAGLFPSLRTERSEDGLELMFRAQPGLKHEVCLSYQAPDELHLLVGHFWLEWFPCGEASVRERYADAAAGFLSGAHRIVEHYRGQNCFKAELQRPGSTDWQTVGTWSKLRWPSFSKPQLRVKANA